VLEIFQQSGVKAILHAGDICIRSVLDELNQLAPVTAVRGNRDWSLAASLPAKQVVTFLGIKVGLAHGHGSLWLYLMEKVHYVASGYQIERYQRLLQQTFPTDVRVFIFGHTHHPENHRDGDFLIFNPGSACCPDIYNRKPSVGILRFYPGQRVEGEIVRLT
jgi:putative phosphoesterase